MKFFLAFFLSLSCNCIYAQYKITGKIFDKNNNPLPFVDVKANNTRITKVSLTDKDGVYTINNLPASDYEITIHTLLSKEIKKSVTVTDKDLDLGITFIDQEKNLQEVVITGQKKQQVEQKIDRLVINVEGTPIGISGSALEVLQRLPGVEIGSNGSSITLNGKSEVGVLINDKLTRIPISSLIQILSSTNAKDIEKIELISIPPAKYDAEFTGGLINIKQVKKNTKGTNGSILAGLGFGKKDKEKFGINWNARNNKINFYGDLNYDRNNTPRTFTNSGTSRSSDQSVTSNFTETYRDPIITGYSGRLGLDYYINSKFTFGVLVNGNLNNFKQEASGFNIKNNLNKNYYTGLFNDEDSDRNLFTSNLNLNYKIDSLQVLNFDVDYLKYLNKAPNNYNNHYFDENGALERNEIFSVTKNTPVAVGVGKIDYSRILSEKIKLDFGGKYTYSKLDNTVLVNDLIDGQYVQNNNLSEKSNLTENISATYLSVDWGADEKTNIKLGLRYEYSTQKLDLLSAGNALDTKLSELFPSLFFSREIGKKSSLQASYGRRVSRPTYFDLAPYVLFLDPNTFYFGNIRLKPSISNILSLNYKFQKYIASVEYSHEKNSIARSQIVFLPESSQQRLTSLNLDYLNTLTFSINAPLKINKWWEMQNSFQLSYINQKIDAQKNDDYFFIIRTTQTFSLPKDFSIQLFSAYNSNRLSGVSKIKQYQRVNLSLDKKIKKMNSSIQLSFNNVFGQNYSFESFEANNSSFVKYSYEPRIIRLTYIYNFGNSKLSKQRKREVSSEEIKNRLD
ncbi:outer membrane beta-barrel protein [Pedobacter sp. WC2423]|uniref:outer membrane beta-barrel protein n=1 Tax=Pedobacter sp. WC2423 TaxID=3234142 RepID=UPI003465FE0E